MPFQRVEDNTFHLGRARQPRKERLDPPSCNYSESVREATQARQAQRGGYNSFLRGNRIRISEKT